MTGGLTAPMLIQTIVCLAALFVLIMVVAYRTVPKARYFIFLSMAVFLYAVGYLLELDSHSLEGAYMAQRIQYYGVSVYAVLFYLFVRDYVDRGIRKKWVIALLFAFPVLVVVMVNAYPDIRWYFTNTAFAQTPSPGMVAVRGPMFTLHVLYSGVFLLLTGLEVLIHYPRGTPRERRKRWLFLLAAVAPGAAITYFATDHRPVYFEFGPASLTVTLIILGTYIIRCRAEDWLPFARGRVMEQLSDGYVLLDKNNRFLDANVAAEEYFPSLRQVTPQTPATEIEGFPDELAGEEQGTHLVTVEEDGRQVVLQASVSPISAGGQVICNSILLYDVTDAHKAMGELEQIATHDGLTGLLNRESMLDLVRRDFDIHSRTGQNGCMLMMDIDHFKTVNDTCGHQCGDYVLQQISRLIASRLRRTDICGRYGGEEFCVFLPATGLPGALKTAGGIRKAVENFDFSYGGRHLHLTISIGVASLEDSRTKTLEEVVNSADKALYQAKRSGRNKVVSADAEGMTKQA